MTTPSGSYTGNPSGIVARQAVTITPIADGDQLNASNIGTADQQNANYLKWLMDNASVIDSVSLLTLSNGWAAATFPISMPPKCVVIGKRTFLSGRLVNGSGGVISGGSSAFTMPAGAGFRGGATNALSLNVGAYITDPGASTITACLVSIQSLGRTGSIVANAPNNAWVDLDGIWFWNTLP